MHAKEVIIFQKNQFNMISKKKDYDFRTKFYLWCDLRAWWHDLILPKSYYTPNSLDITHALLIRLRFFSGNFLDKKY